MDGKRFAPSIEEKREAGEILQKIFFYDNCDDVGIWIHGYLQRRSPGIEKILAADDDADELLDKILPITLVDMFGSELFDGPYGAELRTKILELLFEQKEYKKICNIFFDHMHDVNTEFKQDLKDRAEKYLRIYNSKKYPWRAGGFFSRRFVEEIRLAYIFAGIRSDPKPGRIEEAVPKADIGEMMNFQKNMKMQIVEILEGGHQKRAIVTLPTGAGKTRIVVEAIVEFLIKHGTDRNILWIAQSQEVCEQAVLCFKQIWEQHGRGEVLNIFRAWGSNSLPTPDEYGIIVGGYQKLVSCKKQLHNLSDDDMLAAVFIDEAHHSTADSYRQILNGLGMSGFPSGILINDNIPLVGLTATPERRVERETEKLHMMYGEKKIYPNEKFQPDSDNGDHFGDKWKDLRFMRTKLTESGYIAEPVFHGIDPGNNFKLTRDETEDLEQGGEQWIKRIATEAERNKNIKDELLKWAKNGRKILYFGTNVSQSNAMARLLEKEEINSVCITGDTRYAVRRAYVNLFNSKNDDGIQVMCNYNVLATGFDSPQIDTVIIARPTTSVVSYQQMIGRGLRGVKFGGNASNKCDIVTVKDNITKFNNQRIDLGYTKYEEGLKKR